MKNRVTGEHPQSHCEPKVKTVRKGIDEPDRGKMSPVTVIAGLEQLCMDHPWNEEQIASHLQNPDSLSLFVLADGGIVPLEEKGEAAEVVGYALVLLTPPQGVAEILRFGIKPGWRRRGLALQLLTEIENTVDPEGGKIDRILLEVAQRNEAARLLYTKFGFREIRRRRSYYSDGDDALVLEKTIARPHGTSYSSV